MTNRNPEGLRSARIKIERAKHHIKDLQSQLIAWGASNPYEVIPEDDPEAKRIILVVRIRQNIPNHFSAIVGDVVHNLRCSLDHPVWDLVLANDKTPTQRTEFPINYDRAAFESDGLKRLAGLSDEAFKAIKELQPYKEGNGELLWVLQELSRTDKHRTIILIGTTHTENEMRFSVGSPGAESFQWISGPVGIKSLAIPIIDGGPIAEITYTSPFPPETHIHNQFTFEVLFGDNSPLVGKRGDPEPHRHRGTSKPSSTISIPDSSNSAASQALGKVNIFLDADYLPAYERQRPMRRAV